jgi:hypothetical protein
MESWPDLCHILFYVEHDFLFKFLRHISELRIASTEASDYSFIPLTRLLQVGDIKY